MNQLILLALLCFIHLVKGGYPFEGICETLTHRGKNFNGFYEVFGDYSSKRYSKTLGLIPTLECHYLLEDIVDDETLRQGLDLIIKKDSQSLLFGRETFDERVNYYYKKILIVKRVDKKENEDGEGEINIKFSYFVPAYDSNYDPSKDKYCRDLKKLPPFYLNHKK